MMDHDAIQKLSDQWDRESAQKWARDQVKKRMEELRADVADAFNAAVVSANSLGGDEVADVVDARDRVFASLAQIEDDLVKLAEKPL